MRRRKSRPRDEFWTRMIGRDGSAREGHSQRWNDIYTRETCRFNAHLRRGDRDLGRWQWRRRRLVRDGAIRFPSQPYRHNALHGAESCHSAKRPAAQTQSHSPLRQKQPTQQPRPAAIDRNPGSYGCPLSEKLTPPSTQSPPIVVGPSSKQISSRGVKMYAKVVLQRPNCRDELREIRRRQSTQFLKRLDHPVDPAREGRCFRCLGRGHAARECWDPITCRLCRQPGHRQASCPHRRVQRSNLPGPGMFDCLVGDVRGEDPLWEHILDAI